MPARGVAATPARRGSLAFIAAAILLLATPSALADPPVFTPPPPADITAEATSSAGAAVSYTLPGATDENGVPAVSCTPASGSTFAIGSTPVSCIAEDPVDLTTQSIGFNVIVRDTTAPVLQGAPGNIGNVQGTSALTPVSYTPPTGSDLVDGNVAVACDHPSGSGFAVGTTTVTCTATDAHGNQAAASFTVTVVDTQAPALQNVPASIGNVQATGALTPVSYTPPTASDLVDGAVAVSCDHPSGSGFAVGTTTVSCAATDAHGNQTAASFTVTVVDTQPPTLQNVPANISNVQATGALTPVSYSPPTASDLVDGNVPVSCDHASGSTFPLGTTTVTCSASDSRQNAKSASFTVTVVDTAGPAFSNVPATLTLEANGPKGSVATYTSPSAVDLVEGPIPLVACNPPSKSTFPLGSTTVNCTASDSRRNVGTASFVVQVVDRTPPVLTVPQPLTLYTTASDGCPVTCPGLSAFLSSASASDLVDPKPKVAHSAPDVLPLGVTPVGFVATDTAGNRASKSVNVTVVHIEPGTSLPPRAAADVKPPPNVTGLSAKVGNGFVLLRWTNPSTSDFDHVAVYRSSPSEADLGVSVFSGRASQYRDRGLKNGVQQRYVVVSFDRADNRSVGVAILATPKAPKLLSPADGAVVRRPPVLRWVATAEADYYNVQLFRLAQESPEAALSSKVTKLLSAWPRSTRLVLKKAWRYAGHTYRLARGTYRWFVWPGYGEQAANKYGALLGESTFVVK